MITDFQTDHRPGFLKLAQVLIPDGAEAALQQSCDDGKRHAAAFADSANRQFPIHTKEATALSAAYVKWAGLQLPEMVADRLKQACTAFDVQLPVEQEVKSAAADEDTGYALMVKSGGETSRFYPMHTAGELVKSAYVLVDDFFLHKKLPASWYRDTAVALRKQASEFGVQSFMLPPDVVSAGDEDILPDFEKASAYAQLRSQSGAPPEAVAIYADLVKYAEEHPTETAGILDDIHDLDRTLGVRYNSSTLPDPVSMFYCGPKGSDMDKAANAHVLIKDVLVPVEEVCGRFDPQILRKFVGKSHMEKLGHVVDLAGKGEGMRASAVALQLEPEVQREFLTHLIQRAA